jgi:hypothetical protein
MGGGLMQLVAYGAQDIYLTGNPQITFFKVVYRRHTNFSMETIQQTINGTPSTGGNSTVTISRNGDLVHKVYVCSADGGSGDGAITKGSELVNQVELEIGGQMIDRQTSEWMQVWNELSTPDSKARALKCMQGDVGINGGDLSQLTAGVSKIQVPLLFWFCRNPGLALPLIALQYHEVKLKFTWGTTATVGGGIAEAQIWADYIYLDTDERRRFAQVSHEYLIEQVQIQAANGTSSNKLNFNHPVKELIWTNTYVAQYGTAQLKLNGHDRFAEQTYDYFQLRQPFDYHTAVPIQNIPLLQSHAETLKFSGVGIVAASPPTSGSNVMLDVDAGGGDGHLSIYWTKRGKFHPGDVIKIANETQSEEEVGTIKTCPWAGNIYVITFHSNYGTITDSANDDVIHISTLSAALSRTTECRTSVLDKMINVYSFALKPEEHQPSGTCNFSRIDNAKLDFTSSLQGIADLAVPTTASNIYAVNYNVLRIMSGMGGLAYSN